ncbi:3-hydroxyisobutyryl-CoA hydrolase-like protein 5 [Capsicum chacoense]
MGIASFPSSILMFSTPPKILIHDREVDIAEEIGCARVLTLNRPNQINFISNKMALMLGQKLEKYEKDDNVELVIIKGAGRTFSAGGNVKAAFELAYRIYRLCYHIHTYKKPHIALVHGVSVDGGASLMVPMKYSIVTEKAWCSTPEASLGSTPTVVSHTCFLAFQVDWVREYLGLTGERLRGKDVVAAGLATHFVPSQKLFQLEKCLLSINNGEEDVIRSVIDEFSTNVQIDERRILNKLPINNECFSRKSVEEIVDSFEVEAGKKGNDWIVPVLKRMKKASPTGLKITLKSIREGIKQTLSECLRREFRITINTLQTIISDDIYEGIRAIIIDKDKSPKWNPSTLDEVHDEQLDLIFKPFEEHDLELQIPVKKDECRCQKSKEGIVKSNTPNYDLLTS